MDEVQISSNSPCGTSWSSNYRLQNRRSLTISTKTRASQVISSLIVYSSSIAWTNRTKHETRKRPHSTGSGSQSYLGLFDSFEKFGINGKEMNFWIHCIRIFDIISCKNINYESHAASLCILVMNFEQFLLIMLSNVTMHLTVFFFQLLFHLWYADTTS